jgi:hypothetical protein
MEVTLNEWQKEIKNNKDNMKILYKDYFSPHEEFLMNLSQFGQKNKIEGLNFLELGRKGDYMESLKKIGSIYGELIKKQKKLNGEDYADIKKMYLESGKIEGNFEEYNKEFYYAPVFFDQLKNFEDIQEIIATLFGYKQNAFKTTTIKELAIMVQYIVTDLSTALYDLLQKTKK